MKKIMFVAVLLASACGNSEPPKAPEPASAAPDAAVPAKDAGALAPDKK